MNKKSIIICITVLAVLLLGIAVAVFFLYSGTGESGARSQVPLGDSKYGLYQAVPSDAVAVLHFDRLETLVDALSSDRISAAFVADGKFRTFLDSLSTAGIPSGLHSAGAVLSYHYVGGLQPLLVIDAAKSGADIETAAAPVRQAAASAGLFFTGTDCQAIASGSSYLSRRTLVAVSTSDVLLSSSQRHISKGISILDKDAFAQAVTDVQGGVGQIIVSTADCGRIMENVCTAEYKKYADFLRRTALWSAFSVDMDTPSRLVFSGTNLWNAGPDKFMNVFSSTAGTASTVFSILPSYTVSAFSIPVSDAETMAQAYGEYYETRSGRAKYEAQVAALRKAAGITPLDWAKSMQIKEVANASFYVGGTLESILLIKTGAKDPLHVLAGEGYSGDYISQPHDYPFAGFTKALFGSLFSVSDESKYVLQDGWVIVGSESAVYEYASGRALDNTLDKHISGAGLDYSWTSSGVHFLGYFSLTESSTVLDRVFAPKYSKALRRAFSNAVYSPMIYSIASPKGRLSHTLTVDKVSDMKTKAPTFERDTVVTVPTGPFPVKNSGTGKMNSFYQQENMFLCLEDETGKGLWGAKFSTPICGRASTVDYFANGKLQIIFASGSKLYLIDRLGRWVSPFPVELGKEVLLGPDVYDFNGARKYNVMILHKDNTVEMYNLQGRKPASWKGIAPAETIKDLPTLVKVDGKSYWVVRTSIQTLIYPFYGGDPLTVFEGDRKLRPDTAVEPVKGGVKATRYDGRTVTVNINN